MNVFYYFTVYFNLNWKVFHFILFYFCLEYPIIGFPGVEGESVCFEPMIYTQELFIKEILKFMYVIMCRKQIRVIGKNDFMEKS